MDCKQIQQQYEKLSVNRRLYRDAQKIGFKKERITALACKKNIESALLALSEVLGAKIRVENMPSPFAEVYTDNGLPVPEKETREIDLEAQVNEDLSAYRGCKLERWADNIEKSRSRLKHLSKEKKEIISKELQEGAIAIFMPGRDVMFSLTMEELTQKLKPFWKQSGAEQSVADSYLWEHIGELIKAKAKELVADVPEKPYILLTKPTQSPEERTKDKTVEDQNKELVKINKERRKKGKTPQYDMKPQEYVALQKFFTERACQSAGGTFNEVEPLDKDTWTRFIALPLSSGFVPAGRWASRDRRLRFGDDGALARREAGFRLSVRVEI
jgi:hypothetical protein